jgi:Na+/H+-dicarboxylate symporter
MRGGGGIRMEMDRTAMNVISNCMAAAVVARWEGELKLTETPTG